MGLFYPVFPSTSSNWNSSSTRPFILYFEDMEICLRRLHPSCGQVSYSINTPSSCPIALSSYQITSFNRVYDCLHLIVPAMKFQSFIPFATILITTATAMPSIADRQDGSCTQAQADAIFELVSLFLYVFLRRFYTISKVIS